jgi:Hypothetical glycosyl hydrolase family 15
VKRWHLAALPFALLVITAAAFQGRGPASIADLRAGDLRLDAGLIRTGDGNWHTLRNTNKYAVIVTSSGNAKYARLRRGRVLLYACGTNMPSDSTSAQCGVSYVEARSSDWILEDSSGREVGYKGTSSVLTDIGSGAYQRRFVTDIIADLRSHPGVDGVFIDDVTGSLIASGTEVPAKYRDNASYRDAMSSFVKAIGPALRAKGWYVAVNASILDGAIESVTGPAWDGSQYIWWAKQIGPYVDAINMEHWQQNWDNGASVRVSGSASNQAWRGWQRVASTVHGLGKDFFAMDTGALSDVNKAAYLRASFLLDWKPGQGVFFYADNYAGKGDPWSAVATPAIGRPLERKHPVGVGFRRAFTKGVVILNPSPSVSQTFAFKHRYALSNRTDARTISLRPASGLVLPRSAVP